MIFLSETGLWQLCEAVDDGKAAQHGAYVGEVNKMLQVFFGKVNFLFYICKQN